MKFPMINMPLELLIKYFEETNVVFVCNGDGRSVTEEIEE